MTTSHQTILHVDMDAFFTSVEQRDNPEMRSKPVIVGAAPGTRGVVSAASYEARKFGVRSAMPISRAYELCPHGIFVQPRMDAYSAESHRIMNILSTFTPVIEQVSVDEAYLDICGTEKLFGPPQSVAQKIKDSIYQETGLTISAGVAPNKFLAKLASDMDKPDGLTIAPFDPAAIRAWLAPMPCGRLFGVGKITEQLFLKLGIKTIGDIQNLSQDFLQKKFGEHGLSLYDLCRGIDTSTVEARDGFKSISREHTFQQDTADIEIIRSTLLSLAREVASCMRKENTKASTVVLIYRGTDFTKHTRRKTLSSPTDVSRTVFETAQLLFEQSPQYGKATRLIGVGVTGFTQEIQTDLFCENGKSSAQEASEKAVDAIVSRFGDKAIFLGGERKNKKL